MTSTLRRIILVLATSSGILAASSLTADAGLILGNHCEPATSASPASTPPQLQEN